MPGFRQLARNRDFTILWVGETVSDLGTGLSLFALPLLAYHLSGSAVVAAVAEGAYLLGLCGALLPSGVLADRINRKHLMLACSAVGLASFGSVAAAGALAQVGLTHLITAGFVAGAAAGCMSPAQSSAIVTVVSREDLPTAMSQNQARQHVASLLGGPLAGLLYAITRWLPFAADALTSLVSLLAVSRLRTDLSPPARSSEHRVLSDIGQGFRFIAGWPFFRVLLVWASMSNLVSNAIFFVVVLRQLRDGWPTWAIGLTSTAAGIGGLIGAALAPWIIERIRTGTLAVTIAWSCCLPLIPLLWSTHPAVVSACVFALLLMNPAGNAGLSSYRMAMTPDHLQGRAGSASQFAAMSIMPLSPLIGGALVERVGGQATTGVLVLATALLAMIPTASHSIRSVPKPADWPDRRLDSALT